jgi:2-methylcitrate dehydratase PrpD
VTDLVDRVEDLVARCAALSPAALGAEVLDHVGLVFADTVGVIAAGARSAEMRALAADPAFRLAPRPVPAAAARPLTATVRYGDPATVAWLNGTAGTFLELDEGYRPTGHPAIQVVPAALAVAEETHASGPALAAAVVAGYEVAARLFECFVLPPAMHPHGHFGGIGAATAVAMLRGRDPVALARIAATQPLLTGWEACYAGATARNTWCGHANRVGVLADNLHRAGLTGSFGAHLSVVEPYAVRPEALAEPLDPAAPRIRRNYLKFHSACALNHAALDAVRALDIEDPWAVERIEVTTVTANLRIDRHPAPNSLSTRFSLPYAVAAAMVTGSTAPAAFEWRPDVAEYARRVTVTAEPALDERWPAEAPARIRLHTAAGPREVTVGNPRGHHTRPAGRADVRNKFVTLLDSSPKLFDDLAALGGVDDCATLRFPLESGAERASQGPPRYVI